MKKLGLASLALAATFALAGCGCTTGNYKVYSVTRGDTEYVCSKTDNSAAKAACESFGAMTYQLKSGGKYVAKNGNDEHTGFYKVEGDKLYIRDSEDEEWGYSVATIKSGKITFDYALWTVTYKK